MEQTRVITFENGVQVTHYLRDDDNYIVSGINREAVTLPHTARLGVLQHAYGRFGAEGEVVDEKLCFELSHNGKVEVTCQPIAYGVTHMLLICDTGTVYVSDVHIDLACIAGLRNKACMLLGARY